MASYRSGATYCKGILGGDSYRRIQLKLEMDVALDDTNAIPDLITLADRYFESAAWQGDKAWLIMYVTN